MQLSIKSNLKFFILVSLLYCLTTPYQKNIQAADVPPLIVSSKDALVQTESGKVRGYIHTGTFTFKGIPYAQAERFMPPQKAKPWEGVRSTLVYGPKTPQAAMLAAFDNNASDDDPFFFVDVTEKASEDCQRLNIWTQGINDNGKRPVMVWLHGGGFSTGSGHYMEALDGENLSKKGGVVVVTLNHRLNVLGFLDLSAFGNKYKYSGNVGMMDVVAALNWVKNNIANFGGDPNNVTIFGQSGGGGKVGTLMATPSAKGLFHKAIIQSGSTLRVGESAISRKAAREVLNELGLKPEQVDELQKVPYETLAAAGEKEWAKVRQEMGGGQGLSAMRFGWSPTVEGDFLPAQPFDPTAPEISKDIPLLVGTTINEIFTSLMNPSLRTPTQAQAVEQLKKKYGDKTQLFIDEFSKAYPGYKAGDLIDTDVTFRANAIRQANLKADQKGAPVYMYLFAWQSSVFDGKYKAIHTIEVPFVFNTINLAEPMTSGSREASALADKVSQAWINFAKTGNPNHKGLPDWPAFTDEKRATMIFDNKCVVKDSHDRKLLEIAGSN